MLNRLARFSSIAAGTGVLLTVLIARTGSATAPVGHFVIGTADAGTAGTVQDTKTGLTWQQGYGPANNLSTAATYCSTLPLDSGGWRLPRIQELVSLVDPTASPPVDATAFSGTPLGLFWSGTLVATSTGSAWVIDLTSGGIAAPLPSGLTSPYIRCVR